jgi:hypothetical protein
MNSDLPAAMFERLDESKVRSKGLAGRRFAADGQVAATVGDRLSRHDNGYATLVLWDHAFPLGGFGADPMWRPSLNQDSIGASGRRKTEGTSRL